MAEAIRVVLVDDETLLRQCLANLLNRRRGLRVVGEAETVDQALDVTRMTEPDVVVIAPEVADNGVSVVADFSHARPGCPILVLTREEDPGGAGRALRAGAQGYLRKTCGLNDLIRAIERVHAGELIVASVEAGAVLNELSSETTRESSASGLTARELDVVKLIARGWTNAAIARELYITEHTVKGHLVRILSKLKLENRVQLAAYATQQGLLDESESAAEVRR